jgi:hypothetical protein
VLGGDPCATATPSAAGRREARNWWKQMRAKVEESVKYMLNHVDKPTGLFVDPSLLDPGGAPPPPGGGGASASAGGGPSHPSASARFEALGVSAPGSVNGVGPAGVSAYWKDSSAAALLEHVPPSARAGGVEVPAHASMSILERRTLIDRPRTLIDPVALIC